MQAQNQETGSEYDDERCILDRDPRSKSDKAKKDEGGMKKERGEQITKHSIGWKIETRVQYARYTNAHERTNQAPPTDGPIILSFSLCPHTVFALFASLDLRLDARCDSTGADRRSRRTRLRRGRIAGTRSRSARVIG